MFDERPTTASNRPGRRAGRKPTVSAGTGDAGRTPPVPVSIDDAGTTLPSLSPGLTLLDVEGGRVTPILGSLVLDHLLRREGEAFWVDADGHATTASLGRLAPSRRLLDRIHVARGFTAFRHYSALCDLSDLGAECASAPSLIVAPAFDSRYRNEDGLVDEHARTLHARALARLAAFSRDGVPVLVTRTAADAFAAPIERLAADTLTCRRTRLGARFVGENVETHAYPVGDGAYSQTTFAYWRRYLRARAEQVGFEPAPSPGSRASVEVR